MEKNLTAKTWQIDTIDELKAFRDEVNAGSSFAGWTITLGADIDISGENWLPIGNVGNSFQGTFDGADHTITGLTIDNSRLAYAGFFGYVDSGSVQNVTFENVSINAGSYVGTVAGYTNADYSACEFENITVQGCVQITGGAAVGGIIGGGNATLNTVSVEVATEDDENYTEDSFILGTSGDVGGIAGRVTDDTREGDQFSNLTSNIDVKGQGTAVHSVGGIFGSAGDNVTVNGAVCSAESITAEAVGEEYKDFVGGIVGNYGTGVTLSQVSPQIDAISGSYVREADGVGVDNDRVNDNIFSGENTNVITVNNIDSLNLAVDGIDIELVNTNLTATSLFVGEGRTLTLVNAETAFENLNVDGSIKLTAIESTISGDDLTLGENALITIDAAGFETGFLKVIDLNDPDGSFKGDKRIVFENIDELNVCYGADGDICITDADYSEVFLTTDAAGKEFGELVVDGAYAGVNAFDADNIAGALDFFKEFGCETFRIKGRYACTEWTIGALDSKVSFVKQSEDQTEDAFLFFKNVYDTIAVTGELTISEGVELRFNTSPFEFGSEEGTAQVILDGVLSVNGAELVDVNIAMGKNAVFKSTAAVNVIGDNVVITGGAFEAAAIEIAGEGVLDIDGAAITADTIANNGRIDVIGDTDSINAGINGGILAIQNGAVFTSAADVKVKLIYVGYDYAAGADSDASGLVIAEGTFVEGTDAIYVRTGSSIIVNGTVSAGEYNLKGDVTVAEEADMIVAGTQGVRVREGATLTVYGDMIWGNIPGEISDGRLLIEKGSSVVIDGGTLYEADDAADAVLSSVVLEAEGTLTLSNGASVTLDAIVNSGSIALDFNSRITADTLNGEGTITIDAEGFDGISKVINLSGDTSLEGKIAFDNLAEGINVYYGADGDVTLSNIAVDTFYVDSSFEGEFADPVDEGKYYGVNAFGSFTEALKKVGGATSKIVIADGSVEEFPDENISVVLSQDLTISGGKFTWNDDSAALFYVSFVKAADAADEVTVNFSDLAFDSVSPTEGKKTYVTFEFGELDNADTAVKAVVGADTTLNLSSFVVREGSSLEVEAGGRIITHTEVARIEGTLSVKGEDGFTIDGATADAAQYTKYLRAFGTGSVEIANNYLGVYDYIQLNGGSTFTADNSLITIGADAAGVWHYNPVPNGFGKLDVKAGSKFTLENGSVLKASGNIVNAGVINVTGSTLLADGALVSGNVIQSAQNKGVFTNNGTVELSGGSKAVIRELTGEGAFNVSGASFSAGAVDNGAGVIGVSGESQLNITSFDGNAIVAADGATLTDSTIKGAETYAGVEGSGYKYLLSVNGDEAGTLNLKGSNTITSIDAGAGDTVNVTGTLSFGSNGSDGFKLGNGATWNIENAEIKDVWALSLDGACMTDEKNAPVSTMTFTNSTLTANQISAKGVTVGQEIGYGTFNVEFKNSTVALAGKVQTQAQDTADVNISFSEETSVTAKDLLNDSTRGTIIFNGTDEVNFSRVFRNKGTVKILNGAEVTANNTYDTTEHYSANEGIINVNSAALNLTGASTFANSGTIALKNASFSAGAVDTKEGTFTVAGEGNTLTIGTLTGILQALDGAALDNSSVGGTVEALKNLSFAGNNYIKTLKAVNGGTITVEEGKTLALNNFSFGDKDTAGAEYVIDGGTITAEYGFFQHGSYTLNADFETGYMYYSYGSDITVNGSFHSQGTGDGLDYVRGNLTIAEGGSSTHDAALWVGQPADWGEMAASLTVAGYVQAGALKVHNGSSFVISEGGLVLTDDFTAEADSVFEINTQIGGIAEMTVKNFSFDGTLTINAAEGFSGVEQIVNVTGTADYSNEKVVVNGATFARGWDGDVYIHTLSLEYIQVNAAWDGLAFGTEVADGYHIGINAFGGFNDAYNAKTDETKAVVILSDEEDDLSGNTYSGQFIAGEGLNVTVSDILNNGYVNMKNVEVGAGVTFNAKQFNFTGKNTIDGHIKSSGTFYNSGSAITFNGTADVVNVFNRYDASISVKGNAAAGQGAQAESQFKSGGYMGLYSGTFSVENSAAEFGYILMNQNNDASYSAAKLYLDNAAVRIPGLGSRNYGKIEMNGNAVIEAVNGSVLDITGTNNYGVLVMNSGSISLTDSAMLLGREGQSANGSTINGSVTLNSSLLSSLGLINVGADGSITTADSGVEDGINEITAVKIDNQGTISVGGTSTLNIGTLTGNSIELLDGAVIKDSTVGGSISIKGGVLFSGSNTFSMIYDSGTYGEPDHSWTVEAGASVNLTSTDKYGLGYGDNVSINGELLDAKEAWEAGLAKEDASFNAVGGVIAMTNAGFADTTSYFTVEDAYVRIGMDAADKAFNNRVKADGASGTYIYSFSNSVLEVNSFNFQETEGLGNGNYHFTFTDSVLVAGPLNTNDKDSSFTFDNTDVTASSASTNGGALSFVNGSVASYENLVLTNNGELFIADSTFTAGEVSGSGTFTVGAGDSELTVGALKQDIYANQNSTGAITLTGGIGATSKAIRVYGDAELSGFDVNAGYTGKLVSATGRVNVYGNTVIGDNTVMNLNAFQTTHSGVIEAGSVINTANFNAYDMGAADDGTVVDAKFVIEGTVNAVSFIVTNDRYSSNGKDELIVAKDGVVTATYMNGAGRFSLQTGAVTVYGYVYGNLSSGGGSSNIGSTSKRADGETYAMTVTVDGTYASEDSDNGKFIKVGSQKLFIYEGSALNVINGATFSWENTVDNSGTITVDALSTFTATDITRTGTITIDADNFAGGVKKIIDLNSTSLEGSVDVINLGDNNVFYGADGDVFLTDSDRSTLYVGDAYATYEFGTGVNGKVVGYNAYDDIADAVNSAMSDSAVGRVEVEEGNTAELYNWAVEGGAITTVNPNGLVIDLGNNGQSWHWGDIDMATGEAPADGQVYSQIANSQADFRIGENVTVIADAMLGDTGSFQVEGDVEVNAAFMQGTALVIDGSVTVADWLTLSSNGIATDYLQVNEGGELSAAKAEVAAGYKFNVDGTATLNYVEGEGTLNVGKTGTLNLTDGDINAVVNESVVNVTGTDETEIAVSLFNNAGVLNAASGTLYAELINNGGVIDAKGGKIDAGCIQMQYGTWELGGFTASTEDREIEVSFIKEGDSILDGITFKVTLKAGETSISGEAFKGIFSDETADAYMTAGKYIVTAADKENAYAVRGDMTIEQGSFKVTGKSELDIAEIKNGVIELRNGGEITDSSVTIGTVVVYGSDGKISGETTIENLYVGSGYAVEEAVSATITGDFTSSDNFIVGEYGTVNISDATVQMVNANWSNNSTVNITNATVTGNDSLSMTGKVTLNKSSLIATTELSLKGALTLTDSTLDAAVLTIAGTVKLNADLDSNIKFDALTNGGAITFDMTGAEGCILKVMDYTGTGSMELEAYGEVYAGELYSSFRVYNNDLYAVTADFSEKNVTLSTPWAGFDVYEQVTPGCIYGVNAVGSLTELAADVEKLTITGSEGDLGKFTFNHSDVALKIVDSDIIADLTMTDADVTIAEGSTFTGTMTADESIKLSGTGTIDGTLKSSNSGILTINDEITVDVIDGFTSITANAFKAGSISMTSGSNVFYVNGDLTVDGNIDFLTGYEDTMVIANGVTVEAAAINGSGNFTITMDYAGETAITITGENNGAFGTNSNLVINLNSFNADADGSSLLVSGIDAFAGSVVIGNAQLSLGDRIFNGSMLELAITEDGLAFVQAEGDFGVRGDVDNNGLSDILLFNTADNTLSALLPNADGFNMAEIGVLEGSNVAILGTGKVFGTDTEGQSIFYQADSTIKACVMNDGELTETRDIWQVADNGAEVIGLGDFNGDGATDLLVAVPQDADGGSSIGYITEGEWNYFQSLGSEWEVTHVGDFNGDGRDDVVLEHGAGFAGAWLIKEDGTPEWAGLDSIANVETCGVGDFNGDGIDDILVRNGEWVGAWIVGTDGDASNGLVDSFIGIKGDLAVENTIEQIGDFNGDGVDDIVIRTAAGDLGVLSINGDSTDWTYFTKVSEDWKSSIASL